MANIFKRIFNKENALTLGTLALAIGLLIGLAIGIPLSQTKQGPQEKALGLLSRYPLIDGHNDLPYMIRDNFQNIFKKFDLNDLTKNRDQLVGTNGVTHTDIKRIRAGKLSGQFWAIFALCETKGKDAVRVHLEQVDVVKRFVKKYSNDFQLVTHSKDISLAFRNKKIASLLGMESGHAIDSSLAVLRMFYSLGVRYMTLTHNCDVPWATNNLIDRNSNASAYGGLNDFGEKVIKEMNRIGMIVDLSHVSYQTMIDTLRVTKAPVMFSHSSVHKLCSHPRNVRDDVLEKLKEYKGVIMINFYSGFIYCGSDRNANLQDVVEHINYVKNKIGVDYVGIGGDYDGVSVLPDGLEDVSTYPKVFAALIEDGWTEEELAKLAGGNIIRVLSDVEKYAESQQKVAPDDTVIPENLLQENDKDCRTPFRTL